MTEAFEGKKQRPITEKQREVLVYIELFREQFQFPPTYQEISEYFLWQSKAAAYRHVSALAKKGAVTYRPNEPRTIAITDKGREVLAA